MSNEVILKATNICKDFGSTKALKSVSLEIRRGEVVGLVGENGSGKSTFSHLLAGVFPMTSGEFELHGEKYHPQNTNDAAKHGIGMIVQELGTVSRISVAANLFLGEEELFGKVFINQSKMNKAADEALAKFGCDFIKGEMPIDALDMQDKKLVEVVKVMMKDPEILIVDESTTALSQKGRDIIYSLCKKQREENKSVIFISHDLEEIMAVCDRLLVLRDGELVKEIQKEEFEEDYIKQSLIGRKLEGEYYPIHPELDPDKLEVALKAEHLVNGVLKDVSLEMHYGEILGVGGLSHCGMHELGKVLFGAGKLESGEVILIKDKVKVTKVIEAMKHGVGYVPKDRDKEALVNEGSIKLNISVCGFDEFAQHGFVNPIKETKYVREQIDSLSIKCQNENQPVKALSGGNKQKVVFGKWIGRHPSILILDCPTRGVDIGVKAAMYKLMDEMRKEGRALLIISEELNELIGMSDRIIIMKDGEVKKVVSKREEMTDSNLIDAMI